MSELIRISSLEHLMELCLQHKRLKCFIQLNCGARSVKRIRYKAPTRVFDIHHDIDGSRQQLSTEELLNPENGNLGTAIQLGALYAEIRTINN